MSRFDYLKREVSKSNKYDKYFKKSYCEFENLGKGNTDKTLKIMRSLSIKYQDQTLSLSQSKHFKTNSLKEYITKVQTFLYNFYQYNADDEIQYLKSPNCAFSTRFIGHDCKTFSLIAGNMLLNKGIVFYYRKIRQVGDKKNHYSHVYVIVPKDQKNYNLEKGYYIIDGTVKEIEKEIFLESKEIIIMQEANLIHYGLNGNKSNKIKGFDTLLSKLELKGIEKSVLLNLRNAVNHYIQLDMLHVIVRRKGNSFIIGNIEVPILKNKGLNSGDTDGGTSSLSDWLDALLAGSDDDDSSDDGDDDSWFDSIDWDDLWSNIISGNWGCIGGTAFHKGIAQSVINDYTSLSKTLLNIIKQNQNKQSVENALNEYIKVSYWVRRTFIARKATGLNKCSRDNLQVVSDVANSGINKLNQLINTIKNKYNVKKQTDITTSSALSQYANNYPTLAHEGGHVSSTTYPIYRLTEKKVNPTNNSNDDDKSENNILIPTVLTLTAIKLAFF